jgi:predicted RNase H-like HicB family nuclease
MLSKRAREKMKRQLTAIIEREGDGFVALCPELDIASQGETIEEARHNLQEALELFFEAASEQEISNRLNPGSQAPAWEPPMSAKLLLGKTILISERDYLKYAEAPKQSLG